jgi:hypothetical protein
MAVANGCLCLLVLRQFEGTNHPSGFWGAGAPPPPLESAVCECVKRKASQRTAFQRFKNLKINSPSMLLTVLLLLLNPLAVHTNFT